METLTAGELNRLYIEWLDRQLIKVYCTLYPEFLAERFPDGVKVSELEAQK